MRQWKNLKSLIKKTGLMFAEIKSFSLGSDYKTD